MPRPGLFSQVRGIDAFGKTLEDVKIKTGFGGMLTLISFALIVLLTLYEFMDYRRVHMEPSIVVDKSRGEKIIVNMNITFPHVPCYLLSLDVMDISGEHQNDVHHDMTKTRLSANGKAVRSDKVRELRGDLDRVASQKKEGYCGSCYGGTPAEDGPNPGCCNTCDEVREAYVRKGWSFVNPDTIEQCVSEGWTEKIKAQESEGCNVAGQVHVNKVIGNFHLSPGRSFQTNSMHVHDLVPYLQGGSKHDFGHIVHRFAFESEHEQGFTGVRGADRESLKASLGLTDPLRGVVAETSEANYMFQYFLKVVSSRFVFLDGRELNTHQYSVTQYERDLTGRSEDKHHQTTHGFAGVPGVFFNYEISPLKVVHEETHETLTHFLTSTCAIVGGVLTIAGLIDSFVVSVRAERR